MLQIATNMTAVMNNPELWNAVLSRDASRAGSKSRSSALQRQNCRPAKHRVTTPHSKVRDCSLPRSCWLLSVTCYFTSLRFDEAIIEERTAAIYPKLAFKLQLTSPASYGALATNRQTVYKASQYDAKRTGYSS